MPAGRDVGGKPARSSTRRGRLHAVPVPAGCPASSLVRGAVPIFLRSVVPCRPRPVPTMRGSSTAYPSFWVASARGATGRAWHIFLGDQAAGAGVTEPFARRVIRHWSAEEAGRSGSGRATESADRRETIGTRPSDAGRLLPPGAPAAANPPREPAGLCHGLLLARGGTGATLSWRPTVTRVDRLACDVPVARAKRGTRGPSDNTS